MISEICLLLILCVVYRYWWTLVPGGIVYGWLRWQTKKDPLWIWTWWEHLKCADVYDG